MNGGHMRIVLLCATLLVVTAWSVPGLCDVRLLAKPSLDNGTSLEETLATRRSIRDYSREPLTLKDVTQLLWAAQGVTGDEGKRTAPSAGALYPLTIYVVVGNVKGLSSGVYRYQARKHALTKVKGADWRKKLAVATHAQRWVKEAPVSFVIAVNYGRMKLYDRRGIMYADMEQGHAAQNLLLQATALGLGAVPVGSVGNNKVAEILSLPGELTAQYVIPVGHPK